jgi:hypothetical protein
MRLERWVEIREEGLNIGGKAGLQSFRDCEYASRNIPFEDSPAARAPTTRNASSRIVDVFDAAWMSWSKRVMIRSAIGWIPALSLRMTLYKELVKRAGRGDEFRRTMTTLQRLLWSSFQLLRSSIPRIWFCTSD